MKRILCLILLAAMLLSLFGCSADRMVSPGAFYYLKATIEHEKVDAVIDFEERELWGADESLESILRLYIQGPLSDNLISPFPRDVALTECNIIRRGLHLTFSEEFAALSGIDLTLACACIVKTVQNYTNLEYVQIQAENSLLDGKAFIRIMEDGITVYDDSLDKLRTEFILYYTGSDRRYLVGHEISLNLLTQDDVVDYLFQQLLTPPDNMSLFSPIPKNTRLLNYTVDDGLCTLNLSSEFESNGFSGTAAQRITLLSIVNTLTQLEEINRVEFAVDGNLLANYRQINLNNSLVYDESAIGPVRTGLNEFDASLYLFHGSSDYLAEIPTRIRYNAGMSEAELIVRALIEYENENEFHSSIPKETTVNNVSVVNGFCTIDLSADFIEETEHLEFSIRSLIASICSLDNIKIVQIYVNGKIPGGDMKSYFQPISPSDNWFL